MTKALSRLGKQLEEAIITLEGVGAKFALIGGLALAPHKAVDRALKALGYKRLHRSADAANYLRDDERLGFVYAHRSTARHRLEAAPQLSTLFRTLRVVSAEGLIALTLQGWVNDSRRRQDLEDIRAWIRANRQTPGTRDPFAALCPKWPDREPFPVAATFKL